MKDDVSRLLDEIQVILKRTNRTTADLARDLDKNYNQVYHWLNVRRFNPGGEMILKLKEWRDREHVKSL